MYAKMRNSHSNVDLCNILTLVQDYTQCELSSVIALQKFVHSFCVICGKYPAFRMNKIALAVSGGADSMSLVSMSQILFMSGAIQHKPLCLLVDHKLRMESTDEALFVKNYLMERELECEILTWEHNDTYSNKETQSNVHHNARNARYRLLFEFCMRNKIACLCTAHTHDDQSETVLMRIMRGSGVRGIAAMSNMQDIRGIKLLRPMLNISRQEVEDFLHKQHWKWVDDQSNYYERYERTKIRKIIKNIETSNAVNGEIFRQRLVLLADNARRAERFLEKYTHNKLREAVYYSRFGYALVSLKTLRNLDEEILLRFLRTLLLQVSVHYDEGDAYNIRLSGLLGVVESFSTVGCKRHSYNFAGCIISVICDSVVLIKRERRLLRKIPLLCITRLLDDITSSQNHNTYYDSCHVHRCWVCGITYFRNEYKISEESIRPVKRGITQHNTVDCCSNCARLRDEYTDAAYIGPCTIDAWKMIKECVQKNKNLLMEKYTTHKYTYSVCISYYDVMMSTYVLYDDQNKPLYSIALGQKLR